MAGRVPKTEKVIRIKKKGLKLQRSNSRRSLNVSETLDGKKWATKSEKSSVYLPKWVLLTHEFRRLTHPAKTVLLAMAYQDWGNTNGCMEITMSIMREFGIGSDHTLQAVKKELLESGLIYQTAESQFLNPGGKPAYFALAWKAIPDTQNQQKHGIKPRRALLGKPSEVKSDALRKQMRRKF